MVRPCRGPPDDRRTRLWRVSHRPSQLHCEQSGAPASLHICRRSRGEPFARALRSGSTGRDPRCIFLRRLGGGRRQGVRADSSIHGVDQQLDARADHRGRRDRQDAGEGPERTRLHHQPDSGGVARSSDCGLCTGRRGYHVDATHHRCKSQGGLLGHHPDDDSGSRGRLAGHGRHRVRPRRTAAESARSPGGARRVGRSRPS